jgi:hypothetical protein
VIRDVMAIKRKDGYEEFLKKEDDWKGPHGKLEVA